ncbi:AAA family ATPase, partial [Streptomyces sp. NPDC090442]|uniref:AAA family ATPase n=1 Tax=Streptomyces sp. NPDC090442 TaxID=3365962 RepID=UPI0038253D8D
RLTDGQGRTVDFRNTLLILTSNLGSTFLMDPLLKEEQKKEKVLEAVRAAFRPEFLNRLDDLVVFHPLGTDQLQRIARIQLDHLQRRLGDRRLTLDVTDRALTWLAWLGQEPVVDAPAPDLSYGARPLRRLVQTAIGDQLARAILAGDVLDGDTVRVDVDTDGERLSVAAVRPAA